MRIRILIACEYSGTVRDAFTKLGHDVISCDFLPTESKGRHYQGDVRDLLYQDWDLLIGHPPCTYITNSGVSWLHKTNQGGDYLKRHVSFLQLCIIVI